MECPKCKSEALEHPIENCSCHISPPCSACTAPRLYCECGWEEKDEVVRQMNDYVYKEHNGRTYDFKLRELDPTKIDYHSKSHTHFTMIREGVYPPDTTREQVEAVVRGSFGGRFEHFGGGKFKYVVYTD